MNSSRLAIFAVFFVVLATSVLADPAEKSRTNDKASRRDSAAVAKKAEANDEAQKMGRAEAEQNDEQQNDAQEDSVNFNSVEGNLNVKTWN